MSCGAKYVNIANLNNLHRFLEI